MSFLKDSGPIEGLRDILLLNKDAGIALVNYHTAVMRQDSELSERDRELIAAYVSGLNNCQYCHGVHSVTAQSFGVEEGLLKSLLEDLDSASIDERLKPILRYAKQLTLDPAKITDAQAEAILDAGWNEQTLHDTVNVVCLFNFMNRLVEGHGVKGHSSLYDERGKALQEKGYDPLLTVLSKGEGI